MARPAQLQLMDMTLRRLAAQLTVVFSRTNDAEDATLPEMQRYCMRSFSTILNLFASPKFRSERLELLLLRYISEEGVNQGVVDRLEAAQRRKEDRENDDADGPDFGTSCSQTFALKAAGGASSRPRHFMSNPSLFPSILLNSSHKYLYNGHRQVTRSLLLLAFRPIANDLRLAYNCQPRTQDRTIRTGLILLLSPTNSKPTLSRPRDFVVSNRPSATEIPTLRTRVPDKEHLGNTGLEMELEIQHDGRKSPVDCAASEASTPATVQSNDISEPGALVEDGAGTTEFDLSPYRISPFLSQQVHDKVLRHISSLPRRWIKNPKIIYKVDFDTLNHNKQQRDDFSSWYLKALHYQPERGTQFTPPPFREVLEELVELYIDTVFPFFNNIGHAKLSSQRDPKSTYHLMIEIICERHTTVLRQRWDCGLLRQGQVRLVEIAVRAAMTQVQSILDVVVSRPMSDQDLLLDSTAKIQEMMRVCIRTTESLDLFFASKKFRSERLELLLLRYLKQEDINWTVVRGVEAACKLEEDRIDQVWYSPFAAFILDPSRWFPTRWEESDCVTCALSKERSGEGEYIVPPHQHYVFGKKSRETYIERVGGPEEHSRDSRHDLSPATVPQ
ncbi:hypothetical protein BJ508DRAFT_379543 [Ascobolus immersus RN42]|uniref:Uncharacterized protein n=1 Tax=Ascobolus immersus RN42 TaxID=1160509 RepID=A0A3N4HR54_ASCIM|nr:hypothetical protein BJ508DRAFT_379543 [Ascobolus immersus RN42]